MSHVLIWCKSNRHISLCFEYVCEHQNSHLQNSNLCHLSMQRKTAMYMEVKTTVVWWQKPSRGCPASPGLTRSCSHVLPSIPRLWAGTTTAAIPGAWTPSHGASPRALWSRKRSVTFLSVVSASAGLPSIAMSLKAGHFLHHIDEFCWRVPV